jgi:TPR repeat protein
MLINPLLCAFVGLFVSLALLAPVFGQTVKVQNDEAHTAVRPEAAPGNKQEEAKALAKEAEAAYFAGDYATAFPKYKAAAELGDIPAANALGAMYEDGKGVAKDTSQALLWLHKAADGGVGAAMGSIGVIYYTGDGPIKQDKKEAIAWFRKAANAGNSSAFVLLGDCYLAGDGVRKDPAQAVAWYQKAVDAGQRDAYWRLAMRYINGEGVARDADRAADLAYQALIRGVQKARDTLLDAQRLQIPGDFLKHIQQLLAKDGFYKGRVDGRFGPQMRDAITQAFNSEDAIACRRLRRGALSPRGHPRASECRFWNRAHAGDLHQPFEQG